MSIIITNVSTHDDLEGENDYELCINKRHMVSFKHVRSDGLAECLRRAAEAVEAIDDVSAMTLVFATQPQEQER